MAALIVGLVTLIGALVYVAYNYHADEQAAHEPMSAYDRWAEATDVYGEGSDEEVAAWNALNLQDAERRHA